MGSYKINRRRRLVRGPSILRVFGSSYKYKEEAKTERAQRRKGQRPTKSSMLQTSTHRSVRAVLTPMGNKR